MRHVIPAWIRIPFFFLLIAGGFEFLIDSGEAFAFVAFPMLGLVLLLVLLFLIAAELILDAMEHVLFKSLTTEARMRYMQAHQQRLKKYDLKEIYNKAMGASGERDIELDHNYDGIKELDNKLPPWWLYSFYVSIVFAFGYMMYYHVLDGDNQVVEYEQEMLAAEIAVEEYKKNAPDLVDVQSVVELTAPEAIEKGAAIYQTNCMACHSGDGGGGIGPNLTDDHWILGGGIKNVFQTISEGGRAGKGMVAWKSILKPTEIQQVSSYILSLKGSSPVNPKDAEGEIWTQE